MVLGGPKMVNQGTEKNIDGVISSFIIVVCSYFFSCVVFITEDDVDITIVLAVFSLAIQGRNVQIKTHPALTPANVVITLDKRTVADTTSMFSLKKPAGA